MARGPKKHLKRIAAPKHWMLDKMGGQWAPRPNPGPHKLRECLPLVLILRNRLKYALNGREVIKICMNKFVQIDGKIRTDTKFPCGFMDVISLKKSKEHFRLMYDVKGRYTLVRITDEESKFKLCKVVKRYIGAKRIPHIQTHDGRTIRYPDPVIKVNDTIKIDIETGKILEVIKFDIGKTVVITKGGNCGRMGTLIQRDRHLGGYDIVHVRDAAGTVFATRLSAAFVLANDADSIQVELPKGNGVKLTVVEERAKWLEAQGN